MPDIVFRRDPSEFGAEIRDATQDIGDLLDLTGQRMKEASVLSFQRAEWDGSPWAEQYPGKPASEFANTAAILEDLNRGVKPKARRFRRKRALSDTDRLLQSIAYRRSGAAAVEAGTIKAGTAVEYAPDQFFGATTTQPVTETAKETLKKWMKTKAGKKYGDRIAFLLESTELSTQINARQFLGIDKVSEKRIRKDVVDYFDGRLRGDS